MFGSKTLLFAIALVVMGCGGDDGSDTPPKDSTGGKVTRDAAAPRDSSTGRDDRDAGSDDEAPGKDAGKVTMTPPKTPISDAGTVVVSTPDGGTMVVMADPDGGTVLHGKGSCCEARDTPGCGNADLEVCVCEKDPSCCTKAWGRQCTILVEQKFCQPTVRDCVCGSGEGQWGQTACCESSWSSTCDTVAKNKCDAVPGCF